MKQIDTTAANRLIAEGKGWKAVYVGTALFGIAPGAVLDSVVPNWAGDDREAFSLLQDGLLCRSFKIKRSRQDGYKVTIPRPPLVDWRADSFRFSLAATTAYLRAQGHDVEVTDE